MKKTVVSLKQARKLKARAKARAEGDANAARHGLSKAQKEEAKDEEQKLTRYLDPHFRER